MLKLCGNVGVSEMPSLRIVQLLVATICMMMPRSSMGFAFLPNSAMNNNKNNPQDMLQQFLSSFTSTPKSTSSSSSSSSSKKEDAKMDATIYDLVVIGAGVVGATAAMTAAQDPFGKTSVALIDSPYESGRLLVEAVNDDDDNKDQEPEQDADLSIGAPTGLFSKALRDTSKRIQVSTLRGMGLREDSIWNEIVSSCVNLASSNAQDIVRQLEFCGVHYYRGLARFEGDPHSITMIQNVTKDGGIKQEQKTILRAKKILLATGSSPFLPAGIPFDGKRIFDSDSINTLSYLPKSIAITGSGIIAVEFAKIFRNLGAEVTLIIRDNVPRNALMKIGLDRDVAAMLVADIVRSGIRIERGAQVQDFFVPPIPSSSSNTIRAPIRITLASLDGKSTSGQQHEIFCDAYLAAVGRQPNTHSLNLESVGIETDAYGGILVDSNLCTTSPAKNIYAAGDVVGRPFLASTYTFVQVMLI
jgi:pyruvate/2-oxoglutarate dehydrogenase complex dihydrolipoamide dehydrogenase (E3) component